MACFFNSDSKVPTTKPRSLDYQQSALGTVGGDFSIAWENRFSGRSFNMWLNDNFFHIGRSSKLSSWLDSTLENGSHSHDTNAAGNTVSFRRYLIVGSRWRFSCMYLARYYYGFFFRFSDWISSWLILVTLWYICLILKMK